MKGSGAGREDGRENGGRVEGGKGGWDGRVGGWAVG